MVEKRAAWLRSMVENSASDDPTEDLEHDRIDAPSTPRSDRAETDSTDRARQASALEPPAPLHFLPSP